MQLPRFKHQHRKAGLKGATPLRRWEREMGHALAPAEAISIVVKSRQRPLQTQVQVKPDLASIRASAEQLRKDWTPCHSGHVFRVSRKGHPRPAQ
jgi:hypothetical protein